MKKNQYCKVLSKAVLVMALMSVSVAHSANFGVVVLDEYGNPMGDARVCLGLPGNRDQFGMYTTSAEGQVMVKNLPNIPMQITVSKYKYQGVEFIQPRHSYNLMRNVTLLLDGEGPKCGDVAANGTLHNYRLDVDKLEVSLNKGVLFIESKISGDLPTHYRVSSSKEFTGARWKAYEPEIAYYGRSSEQLYFQVRRFSGKRGAWLEARSKVATVYLN